MATFNLQNNVVNAFFLKRRRREAICCVVATLNNYVKRSKSACKMHHHGYVKAAFWCEKMLQNHAKSGSFPFLMAGCFLFDFLDFGN